MIHDTWNTLHDTVFSSGPSLAANGVYTLKRHINRNSLEGSVVSDPCLGKNLSGHEHLTASLLEKKAKSLFLTFESQLHDIPGLNSRFIAPQLHFYSDGTVRFVLCGIHVGGIRKSMGVTFDKTHMNTVLDRLVSLPLTSSKDQVWIISGQGGPRPVGGSAAEALALYYTLRYMPTPLQAIPLPSPLPQVGMVTQRPEMKKTFETLMESF